MSDPEANKDGIYIGEAWLRGNEVIVGIPFGYNLPDSHNCNEMGCGSWHVLARFPASPEALWKCQASRAMTPWEQDMSRLIPWYACPELTFLLGVIAGMLFIILVRG